MDSNDIAHEEALGALMDFAADAALEFAMREPFFDWRDGEPLKAAFDSRTDEGALTFRVETPAAIANVDVTQGAGGAYSATLMERYTLRLGDPSAPSADDEAFCEEYEAEKVALDRSRRSSRVYALWPIGRDVYHPVALAFEGFLYRREASRG